MANPPVAPSPLNGMAPNLGENSDQKSHNKSSKIKNLITLQKVRVFLPSCSFLFSYICIRSRSARLCFEPEQLEELDEATDDVDCDFADERRDDISIFGPPVVSMTSGFS